MHSNYTKYIEPVYFHLLPNSVIFGSSFFHPPPPLARTNFPSSIHFIFPLVWKHWTCFYLYSVISQTNQLQLRTRPELSSFVILVRDENIEIQKRKKDSVFPSLHFSFLLNLSQNFIFAWNFVLDPKFEFILIIQLYLLWCHIHFLNVLFTNYNSTIYKNC